MTAPKAGWKGAVYISDGVKIGGSTTWTYSGETRNMQDIDEFEDEYIKQLPLQIVGGDITITAHCLLDTDAGQKALQAAFDDATELEDIRLYTDKTGDIFMKPKTGSHCIVTNCPNIGNDKSGIGTFSATLHVNGSLEQAGSTTTITVATIGSIDEDGGTGPSDASVTLIGELLSLGGDTPDCYFEYGLTDSYELGDSEKTENMDAVDIFDAGLTGLTAEVTYYYRAVGQYTAGGKVYGVGKTFITPAAA